MVLLSADSFNRANSGSLGATDGAGSLDPLTWVNEVGAFGIVSNRATVISGPARSTLNLSTGDVDISALCVAEANRNEGILFRWVDNSNYWAFTQSLGHMLLFKLQAGSPTFQTMITNPPLNSGDTLRVITYGSSIQCFINGVLIATVTDSFNVTAPKHGLYQQVGSGIDSVWDNFSVSTPEPSAAPLNISYPLYTGSALGGGSSSTNPYNQPVSIAGHRYSIEWSLYSRTTISPFREARDQGALPGENSLNPLAAWKRSRDDWSLGAGQTWSDRSLESPSNRSHLEPRQYRESKGIDPWTLGELKLLPETSLAISDTEPVLMLVLGDWLYIMTLDGGGLVYRTTNPDEASPTTQSITGPTGTYLTMATDGERIYISTSDGMWVHDTSGTSASAMTGAAAAYAPTVLEWSNGWLFGTLANEISEIRADGTVNSVFIHPNDGFIFAAVAGTPSMTYFGGQAQDINEMYRVGVKNDGTLSAAIFSGSLPIGEFVRSMSYYGGFLLIGSNKGVHLASQAGDGSLNLARVIRTSTDVLCMVAESQFVWFGWTAYDTDATGLGRMDLSAFSDEQALIPAWASDLMFEGDSADVVSVVRFKDRTYFAVNDNGIVRERYNEGVLQYVAQGTIRMGRFRWGTFEPKVWLGLEVVTDRLTDDHDGSIVMAVTSESDVVTGLGTRGPSDSTTGVGVIYGVGTITRSYDWFEPTIILMPGGGDYESSPIVRRVTLRALPVPKTIEQYSLPLLMAEKVNDNTGEGGEIPYNTSNEYRFLQSLVSQGLPVNFSIGGEVHLVTVREVGWDKVYGMTSDRKGVQGLLMVTLITAEI